MMKMMAISLAILSSIACCVLCVPTGTGEDVHTGIMFNQLAIAELVKQQENFRDIRNQIVSMSSSLVSSQSFLLGFLEKVSNRIEATAGSIDTHLDDSKHLMETLTAIVLMNQDLQNNWTRTSEKRLDSLTNLLMETNARLTSIESSLQVQPSYNHTKEQVPEVLDRSDKFCPHHFLAVGKECFYVLEKKMTWEEARRSCHNIAINGPPQSPDEDQEVEVFLQIPSRRLKRDHDLALVADLAEPEDIPGLVKSLELAGTSSDNFWIGGSKQGSIWKWLSHGGFPSSLWIRGYPRSRDRVVLMRRRSPFFSSRSGRQKNAAICEFTKA